MARITRKTLFTGIAFLLVLAGTNFLTYALTGNRSAQQKPRPLSGPVEKPATTNTDSKNFINKDKKIPEGTITVADLTKNLRNYEGKDVIVRGIIVTNGQEKYSIIDQYDSSKPSIALSPSEPEVTAALKNITSKQTSSINPVTVKGTIQTTPQENGTLLITFVVKSIE